MGVGGLEHSVPVAGTTTDARLQVRLATKRGIDVVIATVVLLVLAPALLLIALAILVLDGRPIFFRQTRVGRGGRPFTIYKFRTMVPDAHQRLGELAHANERGGPLFKASDDPRVTAIGRFLRRTSLDELPQLLNVLVGSMSLIGPRPALPEEREQFPIELLEREQLPQGLSGLWQLEGRNSTDFAVYRDLDLEYVRNWTLRRDLAILVRTPFVVGGHALRRGTDPAATAGGDPTPASDGVPAPVIREVRPAFAPRVGGQFGGVASPPATVSVRRAGAPATAMSMSVIDD
jgi:lipopolysaccharide/colanic/teichoic acid biosynthesis glycosyltransferase